MNIKKYGWNIFYCLDDLEAHSEQAAVKHIREAFVECFLRHHRRCIRKKEELKENEEKKWASCSWKYISLFLIITIIFINLELKLVP